MEVPAYILIHRHLSQQGRATRPHWAVEAMLAACRRCPQWTPDGCGRLTMREYAALLADARGTCPQATASTR
jgi:hypothetical protein